MKLQNEKQIWKGTIGEAIKTGRMTQKEADDMLSGRTDEEQEAYDLGRADREKELAKRELRFMQKYVREAIRWADYECCHAIPNWYTEKIKELKQAIQKKKEAQNK